MRVICFGFGFVGKAYALWLREQKHNVFVCTGKDVTLQEAIDYNFKVPNYGKKFDACIISVPTDSFGNIQDISIVETVLENVCNKYVVDNIVIKSTILPDNVLRLEKKYRAKGKQIYLYPEFLEAKNPIGGVFNQSSLVFGKHGDWSNKEKVFLSKLFGFEIERMTFTNIETASMLKYVHNMWLSCNISFWNSIIRIMKNKNVDFNTVLRETHKSKYFGSHPWHIGSAYGGACLPKDIKAFIGSLKGDSVYNKFLEDIDNVNEKINEG